MTFLLGAFQEWFDFQFFNIKILTIFSTKITKLIEFTLKKTQISKNIPISPEWKEKKII
jgi:hypothetical protein